MGGTALNRRLMLATAYATLIEHLVTEACTIRQLAELSGLHRDNVARIVSILRRRGLIYVGGWDEDTNGRCCVKAWRFGKRPDVLKPPPLPGVVRQQRHRERLTHPMQRIVAAWSNVERRFANEALPSES